MKSAYLVVLGVSLLFLLAEPVAGVHRNKLEQEQSVQFDMPIRNRRLLQEVCPESWQDQLSRRLHAGSKTIFNYPRDTKGFLIAHCFNIDSGCGRDAADAFCKNEGFNRAVSSTEFSKAGSICGPTRYIGDPQRICSGEKCSAFIAVTCIKES